MDFLSRLFGSIPWAGDEVPPVGVMPDAPVALSPVQQATEAGSNLRGVLGSNLSDAIGSNLRGVIDRLQAKPQAAPPHFTSEDTRYTLPSLDPPVADSSAWPEQRNNGTYSELPTAPAMSKADFERIVNETRLRRIKDFTDSVRAGMDGKSANQSAFERVRPLSAYDVPASPLTPQVTAAPGYQTGFDNAPEPVVPSESARTGMRGSDGYQRDRNTRLAILNEQERNRKPTTAGKDATINLDTLPEQLKQVYAQRAENEKKRQALVNPLDGNTILPVAKTADEKKARAAQYEADGLAVPAVFQGMASPEKVRADKMRRAQEESYRQGNWSLMEQVRGLQQKLGVNPAVATAIVADRMQSGPAMDQSNEPRTPDSWEPRLRGDLSQMLEPFLQSAAYGPQGAAFIERQRVDNQGRVDAMNAARGGMSAEQAAGLAAGRALIESGDPAAIQQGIQMVRQYLASNPQASPMQRLPAPGIGSDVQHAAANLYQNDAIDSLIGSVFSNTNLGTGPDRFTWNESGVNAAKERAIRELEGRGLQNARQMVDDWYKRKFDNSWFGSWVMPSPQG